MGNVRIFPLLVFAGISLFVLKALGIMLSGGYVLTGVAPAIAQDPKDTAAEVAAAGAQTAPPEGTNGSRGTDAEAPPEPDKETREEQAEPASGPQQADEPPAGKGEKVDPRKVDVKSTGPAGGATKSELAVLEGLANRRKTLDQREREIDLRENLLKAAEKRIEARIAELKTIEARIEGELQKRDDNSKAEYQRLVKMYSGMKPKDAARIFERLDMNVLTALVSQMRPRVMSSILADMNPAAAERLTLEIANRGKPKPVSAASLPKIESR